MLQRHSLRRGHSVCEGAMVVGMLCAFPRNWIGKVLQWTQWGLEYTKLEAYKSSSWFFVIVFVCVPSSCAIIGYFACWWGAFRVNPEPNIDILLIVRGTWERTVPWSWGCQYMDTLWGYAELAALIRCSESVHCILWQRGLKFGFRVQQGMHLQGTSQ